VKRIPRLRSRLGAIALLSAWPRVAAALPPSGADLPSIWPFAPSTPPKAPSNGPGSGARPTSATANRLLDDAYRAKARHDDAAARESFEQAREAGADPQLVSIELGFLAATQGDPTSARDAFEAALEGPNTEIASQARAELDAMTPGDESAAEETPEHALSEAYQLKSLEDWPSARSAFERARDAGADPQLVSLELGYLAAEEGSTSAARAAFQLAADGPDAELASKGRAEIAALAPPDPATSADQVLDEAYRLKAEGKVHDAVSAFERARNQGANPQRVSIELGYIAKVEGQNGLAREYFEEAAVGAEPGLASQARSELGELPHRFSADAYADAFGWRRTAGAAQNQSLVPTVRVRAFSRPSLDLDFAFYVYAQGTREAGSSSQVVTAGPVILADDYALLGGGARLRLWGGRIGLFAQLGPAIDLIDDGRDRVAFDARVGADLFAETARCAESPANGARLELTPCLEVYGEGVYVSRYDNNVIGLLRPRAAASYLVTGPVAWQVVAETRAAVDLNGDWYNNFVEAGAGQRFRLLAPGRVDLLLSAHEGSYLGVHRVDPAPNPLRYTDLRLEAATYLEF
jgi:hypothetical protein